MTTTMMMAGGGVSGPLPPQARRITGNRIAMASGTHGGLVSGAAGTKPRRQAATRSGPASSDIPRDRSAREVQGELFFFSFSFVFCGISLL